MMRTFDGRVVETFLSNNIKVTGYLEKKESEKFKQHLTTYSHLFSFPDGTITKVQSNDIAVNIFFNCFVYQMNESKEFILVI